MLEINSHLMHLINADADAALELPTGPRKQRKRRRFRFAEEEIPSLSSARKHHIAGRIANGKC